MTKREQITNLVESQPFQRAIIGVIVFNAVALGMETFDDVTAKAGGLLHALDRIVLAIFVAELALRLYAHRWKFFRDPWSVFDFLVVAISLVPASGGLSVLRALRILRALRLISSVPGMKKVVNGLLNAIPAMVSIILLLGMVLYIGAVLATELYGETASQHFGDLGTSLFTLFQVMTGEAWPDIARDVLAHHPYAWVFFVTFILVSTFVVLNLFTAVVVSAMEPERREEIQLDTTVLAELRALRAEIEGLRAERLTPAGESTAPRQTGRTTAG